MAHPFVALQPEYEHDLAILQVKPSAVGEVDRLARKGLTVNAVAQYMRVQEAIGIPIPVQHSICTRESNADFSRSPAQGDRWDRVSVNVPRGIGPFNSWYDAAIYSWTKADKLNVLSVPAWFMAYAMWKDEAYNGFGYRSHGVRSPYLVGGTNLQQIGRYAGDSNWVEEWDTQIGTVPVMLRMIELMPSLAFGQSVPSVAAPSIIPAPQPVPAGVGGALPGGPLTGTKWLQDSLNKLMLPDSDHLVIDGSFGRFTRMAMRAFQKSIGHTEDGLVDDLTLSLMDQYLAKL
ncbi:MAG: hypothetical protein JWP25_8966 [Bradyrhizobium sp.]|nr:hypothetical protein [Bradyrhizobium sp.]